MSYRKITISQPIGSTGSTEFKLLNPYRDFSRIDLESIVLTKSWYVIMNGINNTFDFTVAATPYTATIAEGNYTETTLAVAIETAMNLVFAGFTVTAPSALTGKYTIANASSFIIKVTKGSRTIGFTVETSDAVTHTADSIYNLGYDNQVYLTSSELSQTSENFINEIQSQSIATIPATQNFGGYLIKEYSQPINLINQKFTRTLDSIDFKLIFSDGSRVPNNGGVLTVNLYVY